MDLILWRHAEALDGKPDLDRPLTPKGRKQAARMAAWLRQRLPGRFSVLASPARRAQETARALGRPCKTIPRLAPGASARDILGAAEWPTRRGAVVIVGHQPELGRTAALLIAGVKASCSVKKGGLWWIAHRVRGGSSQVVVRAVVAPDLL